jgi:hypothetical protein
MIQEIWEYEGRARRVDMAEGWGERYRDRDKGTEGGQGWAERESDEGRGMMGTGWEEMDERRWMRIEVRLRRKWGRDKEKRDNWRVKRWKEGDEREGALG